MPAIKPSIYSVARITGSDGRTADFRLGCASIDIYEDVMVPSISAKIQVVNAGGSISDESGQMVTLYEGLKIRGGEKVELRIKANSATNEDIDFISTPLYVRGIKDLLRDAHTEYFVMNLVPKETIQNEIKFVRGSFSKDAKISDHVQQILNDNFSISPTSIDIDPTINQLGFNGNEKSPFELITGLASKSVFGATNGGSAGYFFYQTREGYKFKSIDNLITQSPKAQYVQTEQVFNSIDFQGSADLPSLDYKIVNYEIKYNQDLIEKMKKGGYATERRFFDPVTFQVTPPSDKFDAKNYIGITKNLGQPFNKNQIKLVGESDSLTDEVSKIITETYDRGTISKDVTKELTKDVGDYASQSKMRYNSLFTQTMQIQVPLNTSLHAGDIISCKFPKIQDGDAIRFDKEQVSGLYMIKELCHHFDSRASYTSMLLVRDTYGKQL